MFTACRHLWSDPDLTNTILKGDHPRTSVTKLYSSWLGGFREEDLWMCFSRGSNVKLGPTGGHVGLELDLPNGILKGDHAKTIVTKFGSIWPGSFCGEDRWMLVSEEKIYTIVDFLDAISYCPSMRIRTRWEITFLVRKLLQYRRELCRAREQQGKVCFSLLAFLLQIPSIILRRIDMALHSDTLFWFRASHSLLFLLNLASLAEKQQIPISKSLVWPDRGINPRSTTLGSEHACADHYATDAVYRNWKSCSSANHRQYNKGYKMFSRCIKRLQRLEIRSFPARSGDKIRELQLMDDVYMNYCFQRLVMEAKKQKGDDYPSKSLYEYFIV